MPNFIITAELNPQPAVAGAAAVKGALTSVGTAAEDMGRKMHHSLRQPRNEMGQFTRDVRGVRKEVDALNGSLSGLRTAFRALGVGLVARGLVELSDTYTTIVNRTKTVTDSQRELDLVMKETFALAQETSTGWKELTDAYARIRRSTKDLGLSQKESLRITETLAKGIQLSGATASETASVMRQLGQALSKGKLDGDEFNSIMENSTIVAEGLARTLGVTRGELFKLRKQGKLTADVLVKSLLEGSETIDKEYAEFNKTIAQGFINVKNAAIKFFGSSTQGEAKKFGDALRFIAENFDDVVRAVRLLGEILVGVFVGKVIAKVVTALGEVTTALRALSVAALANPFTALAVGIGSALALLISFSDELRGILDKVDEISDSPQRLARKKLEKEGPQAVKAEFLTRPGLLKDVQRAQQSVDIAGGVEAAREKALRDYDTALLQDIQLLDQFTNAVVDTFSKRLGEIRANAYDRIAADVARQTTELTQRIIKATDKNILAAKGEKKKPKPFVDPKEIERAKNAFESLRASLDPVARKALELAEAEKTLDTAVRLGVASRQEANRVLQLQRRELDETLQLTLEHGESFREQLRSISDESELLRVEHDLRAASNAEREKAIELRKIEQSFQASGKALAESELDILRQELDLKYERKALIEADQAAREKEIELRKKFFQNIFDSVEKVSSENKGVTAFERTWLDALDNVSGALEEFAVTAKFDFQNLVESMLRDLTRLMLRMAAFEAARGLGASPAVLGALGGFAHGGSFTVGGGGGTDSQVVAFRATPGERVTVQTPHQQATAAGAGGGAPTVNVRNVNVIDPETILDVQSSSSGEQVTLNHISRNRDAIRKLLR